MGNHLSRDGASPPADPPAVAVKPSTEMDVVSSVLKGAVEGNNAVVHPRAVVIFPPGRGPTRKARCRHGTLFTNGIVLCNACNGTSTFREGTVRVVCSLRAVTLFELWFLRPLHAGDSMVRVYSNECATAVWVSGSYEHSLVLRDVLIVLERYELVVAFASCVPRGFPREIFRMILTIVLRTFSRPIPNNMILYSSAMTHLLKCSNIQGKNIPRFFLKDFWESKREEVPLNISRCTEALEWARNLTSREKAFCVEHWEEISEDIPNWRHAQALTLLGL